MERPDDEEKGVSVILYAGNQSKLLFRRLNRNRMF